MNIPRDGNEESRAGTLPIHFARSFAALRMTTAAETCLKIRNGRQRHGIREQGSTERSKNAPSETRCQTYNRRGTKCVCVCVCLHKKPIFPNYSPHISLAACDLRRRQGNDMSVNNGAFLTIYMYYDCKGKQ